MSKKRLLLSYMRQYKLSALMFVCFGLIFAGVFFLYDLEAEAVLYAVALCVVLAVIVLAVHFVFYCRRHRERQRILQNIELLAVQLEDPGTLEEADYQQMVRTLYEINAANITRFQSERQESIDYYTTWVHQIKTPISVMRMTLNCEDTDEHRELLAELFRIEQYVEMVLCYFRLDSHSNDFVIKYYDLDQIIKNTIHKYASMFVRRRIRLIYEPVQMKVLTDEKWLGFILEQLLSNAIKYTESGAVTIRVSSDQILSIEDTGIGIAPEDLPRIFEKGFTGYNGRAGRKSTGLGLYLCKRAANNLSHRISVQSEVGKGSIFMLDLHQEELQVE